LPADPGVLSRLPSLAGVDHYHVHRCHCSAYAKNTVTGLQFPALRCQRIKHFDSSLTGGRPSFQSAHRVLFAQESWNEMLSGISKNIHARVNAARKDTDL
jgi:hypothetical protein